MVPMTSSAAQNNPAGSVAGFPCPCCKTMIRFPLQMLLMQPSITSSQCGLELQIDLGSSASVLESVRRYLDGLEHAERILKEGMPG